VEAEPLRVVPRPKGLDGIGGYRNGRRHLGQEPPVRTPEPELAVGLSIHLVALLVDRAVVPATEQREVRERRRAAVRPVADVVPLALVAETALQHGLDPGAPGERYQVVVHVDAPALADPDQPGQSVLEVRCAPGVRQRNK